MAIRTVGYRIKGTERLVRAVRITEKNHTELAEYVCKNGGTALSSEFMTKDGDILDHKITIVQKNIGSNGKTKKAARVARLGDFIVREDDGVDAKGKVKYAFSRVKEDVFESDYVRQA